MALRKIKLYGKLGQLFGREWILDVKSVSEALRAIDINNNGKLFEYLKNGKGSKKYYKISVKNKKNIISKEEICMPFGSGDIYITPVLRGSGKNGIGQAILGVVIAVVGYAFNQPWLTKMGIAMALGGVAQMLAPNSNANSSEQRSSSLFQGNANTVFQGGAVGMIYGRALVPPMPVCMSISNQDINTYDGSIVISGNMGTIIIDFEYSSISGSPCLCGFSEFSGFASSPPKKYRTKTLSGSTIFSSTSCNLYTKTSNFSGSINYDANTCVQTNNAILSWTFIDSTHGTSSSGSYNVGDLTPAGIGNVCVGSIISPTSSVTAVQKVCAGYYCNNYSGSGTGECGGCYYSASTSASETLSDEDTEEDAINRLINSSSWSEWQSTPIIARKEQRTTDFCFSVVIVRTRQKTLPGIYLSNRNYTVSLILERRLVGSSDPWVEAEEISTNVTSDSNGKITIPETTINNVSGYETKIKSTTINYT